MTRARARARTPGGEKRGAKRTGAADRAESSPVSEPVPTCFVDEDLTPQQYVFVEEFCANPTAPVTVAARKAYPGQNDRALQVTACELTRQNEKVRAAIRRRLLPSVVKNRVGRDRVLQLLAESLDVDRRQVIGADGVALPFEKWPPALARLCRGFDQHGRPRLDSFLEILQLAARINAMLTDKVEHSASESLEQILTKIHAQKGAA